MRFVTVMVLSVLVCMLFAVHQGVALGVLGLSSLSVLSPFLCVL